ncbi:MAG: heparinase II/III family protein [Prevotella sp.]|nr:heparinase II/III family protein [Prevotella sp.]
MNKRNILTLVLIFAALATSANQRLLQLPADTAALADRLCQPRQWAPLPAAGDPYWQENLPENLRQSYIRYGERYQGKPWQSLSVTLFSEFKTQGNRVRYEAFCFAKRRQLAALAIAELAEGKGRFIPAIADGLWSTLEEEWWGLPAHYGTPVPRAEDQNVDLFNAETAGLVAWTTYLFRKQLDQITPMIGKRVDDDIERRILQPALRHNHWWKTAGMNWNPWICSNWLSCVLLYEGDRGRQVEAVKQIMMAMDAFVAAYPDDGGCDEGADYWDRAAASLYDCIHQLNSATTDAYPFYSQPKLKAMAAYAYKMYIGEGYCVNFADAHSNRIPHKLNVIYPMACSFGDATLKGYAAYLAKSQDFTNDAAAIFDKSGNWPTLGRELFLLTTVKQLMGEPVNEPLLDDSWLPRLQVMTARRGSLFLAMKGGHNDESHNHNDVGSFIVYADGQPLLIDPGTGEYTSKTFSSGRYSIWTMQSQYHNLPRINGCDEKEGRQFAAQAVNYRKGSLDMRIEGAYPPEARVKSWKRSVRIDGKKKARVTITDSYELDTIAAPTQLMWVSAVKPDASIPGIIRLGNHGLYYPKNQAKATVEDLEPLMDSHLKTMWNGPLYRIVLTLENKQKARITCYVE